MKTSTYRWVGSLGIACLLLASQAHARPRVYQRDGTWARGQDQVAHGAPSGSQYYGGVRPTQEGRVHGHGRSGTCPRCDVPSYAVEHLKSDGEIRAPKRPKKSTVIGDFATSKEAKEIPVNREISRCYLQLLSGTVSINTVVVRPEKTALPQTVRLKPGEFHIIELGSKRLVTGFRISDSGRGTYRVIVK